MFEISFTDDIVLLLLILSALFSSMEASQHINSKFEYCHNRLVYNMAITYGNSPISNNDQSTVTFDLTTTRVIYCLYQQTECNITEDSSVNWILPDDVPLIISITKETKFGAHLSKNLTHLTLKSIQTSFQGVYQCFVETPFGICHVVNLKVGISTGSRLSTKTRLLIGMISLVFSVLLLFLCRKIYMLYYSRHNQRTHVTAGPVVVNELTDKKADDSYMDVNGVIGQKVDVGRY